jgi:hypothetical protein
MNAGAIDLTAIRELAKEGFPTLGNPSLNQLLAWQTLDNMTRSRADTVSACSAVAA